MRPVRLRLGLARVLLAATFAVLATAAVPTSAGAVVYWGLEGGIGIANLDGTSVEAPMRAGASFHKLDAGYPCGVAVDSAHLYWVDASNDGTIGRANLDGSAPDESFIDGLAFPCGIAVTGSHIYWADIFTGTIGRANLDGSGVERSFIVGGDRPCGVAVDGAHVYWANRGSNSIGRADLDGTDADQAFIAGVESPCGLAVSASHVYWGSPREGFSPAGAIGRAGIDGSAVENGFILDAGEPWAVAVNETHLYWTDQGWRNFLGGGDPYEVQPGAVGRARLDGTEVNRRFIPTGLARGVALDARTLPGPPLRPSDYLRYGKLTRDKETGALQLIVYVPARGEFNVDGPAIGWSIDKGNPPPWVGGTFRWKLKLWPGKGRAGKRIRRRLRRKGRAPILLRMTYQQEGRLPLEGAKRLAFLRH